MKQKHNTAKKFPSNCVTVGKPDKSGISVYIKQDVYKKTEKLAKEDISNETGSFLVGDYIEKNGKRAVVICGLIQAQYIEASAASLTFTHKTWEHLHQEKEKNYPEKKIVGWQHSHPGYGVFLSGYDMFIQENFFNLPWQVAYVVDPISETRGFFTWKNGEVQETGGFFVYDDKGIDITLPKKTNSSNSNNLSTVLSILLIIALAGLLYLGIENQHLKKQLDEAQHYFPSINESSEIF